MNKEKYFFDSYNVGDEFIFDYDDLKKEAHRIRASVQMYRIKHPEKRFSVKRVKVLTMAGWVVYLRLRREV